MSAPAWMGMLWRVLYWLWIATEVYVAVVTRTRRRSGGVQDRGSMLLLWVVITGSITLSSWYADVHRHTIPDTAGRVRLLAIVLLAAGLAIRWTAIVSLGRAFSANVAIHSTQEIYQRGLYRLVRHPSYSGLLLIFAGLGLQTRNWVSFAMLVLPPVAALLYRIHVEEAALVQAFPAQYPAYSRATKRLFPGIY